MKRKRIFHKKVIKKLLSLVFLLLLSAFVYREWFTFKLFSSGDYIYYTKDALVSYFPFSVWVGNFDTGGFDVLFWRLPQYILFAGGARAGLEFNVLDRFIIFWPWVVLSVLPMYLLLSTFIKNELAKILGVCVFAYNTYFLSISTQGHLLISVASCLSIASFLVFKIFIDTKKFIFLPLVSLLLLLVTIYDLRIAYVSLWILIVYLIFKIWVAKLVRQDFLKLLGGFFVILILYAGLNLYWVLPTFFSIDAVSQGILTRELFGNEFLNILYSYSLFHPFWTGTEPSWFDVQKIGPLAWSLPIFALTGFMLGRKNSFIIFAGIITAIGVFLTKQSSIPFSGAYEFLFDHLPGFGAFREASKFYYLIALGYAILIGYLIDKLLKKKSKFRALSVIVILTTAFTLFGNVKPVITGEIGSLFIERKIPDDYNKFNDYIKSQNSFFRIAWFPRPSRWVNATNQNPHISLNDYLNKDWKNFRSKEKLMLYEQGRGAEADIGLAFLADPKSQDMLASISAKYIVLPISDEINDDNIYKFFGRNHDEIYREIKKIPYLNEIDLGSKKLKVFELGPFQDMVLALQGDMPLNVKVQTISPSHQRIRINNVNNDFTIYFSNKYDGKWILKKPTDDTIKILSNNFEFISAEKTELNTNKFNVDLEKFCSRNITCNKYENGYSLSLDLYYKPQAYFFLGSVLTIFVLIVSCLSLAFFFIKYLYENKIS